MKDVSLPAYVKYMRNYTTTIFATLSSSKHAGVREDAAGAAAATLSLETLLGAYTVKDGGMVATSSSSSGSCDNDGTAQSLPAPLLLPRYLFDNRVLREALFYSDGTAPASPLEYLMPPQLRNVVDMVRSVVARPQCQSDKNNSNLSSINITFPDTERGLLYQWFLGPALSGAPFHSHAPAFNVLVYGQKLWQLRPPGSDIYSNKHPLMSLQEERKQIQDPGQSEVRPSSHSPRSCSVVQSAGEVLFVPRHVSHSVINLRETVGFAVEVSNY